MAILMSLAFFVLFSCSDDSEVALEPGTNIIGSWSLVQMEAALSGIVTEFQPREITLEFSTDQVVITSDDNYEIGFSVGVYDYHIQSTDSGEALRVGDGILNGNFELFTTQFTIDQRIWDGPLYTFVRNE